MRTFEISFVAGAQLISKSITAQSVMMAPDDYVFKDEERKTLLIVPRRLVEMIAVLPETTMTWTADGGQYMNFRVEAQRHEGGETADEEKGES